MVKEILYATGNPGKVIEVSKLLNHHDIKVVSPKDLGIDLDVPEIGSSLEENSLLKARAYSLESGGRIVLSDDTGLEIDALDGEPGIHIRRWKDGKTRMTDEEIIRHCLTEMHDIPQGQRRAQFRTVLALALPNQITETFEGILRGEILENPSPIKVEGFPFESLFFVPGSSADDRLACGRPAPRRAAVRHHRLQPGQVRRVRRCCFVLLSFYLAT